MLIQDGPVVKYNIVVDWFWNNNISRVSNHWGDVCFWWKKQQHMVHLSFVLINKHMETIWHILRLINNLKSESIESLEQLHH